VPTALQDRRERRARLAAERQLNEARITLRIVHAFSAWSRFYQGLAGPLPVRELVVGKIHGKKMVDVLGRTMAICGRSSLRKFIFLKVANNWCLEKNDVVRSVETFPRPDGVHHYMLHRSHPGHGGQSTLVGRGIALDITERIQLEASCRARSSPDAPSTWQGLPRHHWAGRNVRELVGNVSELIGMGAVRCRKARAEWLTILASGRPRDRSGKER